MTGELNLHYQPQTKVWGKVIFSQVSVCMMSLPVRLAGPMFLLRGLCPRSHVPSGSGVSVQGGVCRANPSPSPRKAGGTHPTGILSCCRIGTPSRYCLSERKLQKLFKISHFTFSKYHHQLMWQPLGRVFS